MASWISLLFFTCTLLSPALCCDWLMHYDHLSNNALSLIKLMGGELTNQDSPVSFPMKLYSRIHKAKVDSQLAFIRDSLQLIEHLWLRLYDNHDHHDHLSSVTWDTTKTEHFVMTIRRQHDEISKCVPETRKANRRLQKYYGNLERKTLTQKGATAESWELIRRETKLHLDQLHMLASSITRAATNS